MHRLLTAIAKKLDLKRRTTKSRIYRYTVYAVLIALVVWAAVSADWGRLGALFFNPQIAVKMFPATSLLFVVGTFIWSKELTTFARDATT